MKFKKDGKIVTLDQILEGYESVRSDSLYEDSRFKEWEEEGKRSVLAKVIIAPENYKDDGQKFFTWEEAMQIKDTLDNGWRLPTRSEWVLICEEFGQKDGRLDANTLVENLGLERLGYMTKDNDFFAAGLYGDYWSSTAYSNASNAYNLYFYASGVYPSDYSDRYYGFPVRLVKNLF